MKGLQEEAGEELKWAGHMDRRNCRTARLRWEDCVKTDLAVVRGGWRTTVRVGEEGGGGWRRQVVDIAVK